MVSARGMQLSECSKMLFFLFPFLDHKTYKSGTDFTLMTAFLIKVCFSWCALETPEED